LEGEDGDRSDAGKGGGGSDLSPIDDDDVEALGVVDEEATGADA
jgi:hypothetical protein